MAEKAKVDDNFNPLVRVAKVDLDGNKQLFYALKKIKGVSFSFANAVCNVAGVDKRKKTGYLTEKEISTLAEAIENPEKFNIPTWMYNRRNDYSTSKTSHIISGDIKFIQGQDIKRMQKTKSYRGMRHAWGLPVRGQRTKGNFRKGAALGVKRKASARSGRV